MSKRNICVVITDKAQLSRLLTLLRELKKSRFFNLQLIVGGGALTYRYGNIVEELEREGFTPNFKIPMVIEGGEHLGMAKTAALGMLEFATAFENLSSDLVLVRGDRFEILPIAAAAAYLNKTVVHLEGGDRSGSIDESVRHAITKLAHIHFATNQQAARRLLKLGEHRRTVFNVGSLDVDFITKVKLKKRLSNDWVNSHGVGAEIDLAKQYVIVLQNPVTTEADQARNQINETLLAVEKTKLPAIWIWPNLDAGSDAIAKRIREWQIEHPDNNQIRFIRYLSPEIFINVANQASIIVGNSSTGIKECSYLGIPAVNIGTRQLGRLKASNVLDVPHYAHKIANAMKKQFQHGPYAPSYIYGNGNTAKKITSILADLKVSQQKNLTY